MNNSPSDTLLRTGANKWTQGGGRTGEEGGEEEEERRWSQTEAAPIVCCCRKDNDETTVRSLSGHGPAPNPKPDFPSEHRDDVTPPPHAILQQQQYTHTQAKWCHGVATLTSYSSLASATDMDFFFICQTWNKPLKEKTTHTSVAKLDVCLSKVRQSKRMNIRVILKLSDGNVNLVIYKWENVNKKFKC